MWFITAGVVKRRRPMVASKKCGDRAMHLPAVSCEALGSFLEQKEDSSGRTWLVLDCRSLLAYGALHVTTAVNAYCPSIVRRRWQTKAVPLAAIFSSNSSSSAEVRSRLSDGRYSSVVLYDESTGNASTCPDDSVLKVVARCVHQQGAGVRNVRFLEGGIERFRLRFPHLCVGRSTSSAIVAPPSVNGARSAQPAYEQGDPVEILPHLFLGSAVHASNLSTLQRMGITALVNVSRATPTAALATYTYKCIPVDDSGSAEIGRWFSDAIAFIDAVEKSGGKVLVHCHAGVSRSATICLAYLMHSQRLRLDEAYEYVKTRRSVISPNFNFMGQLLSFESQLLASRSQASSSNTVVEALASKPTGRELRLKTGQKFIFDSASPDDVYSAAMPSASPLHSPLTPIMSPG